MIFDYKAYSRILNEFIIEGEKIEQYRDPAFNKILEPICKFLRISRLSSAVFGSTCDSAIIKSAPYVYYDDGNADSTRVLKFTETNMRAGKATYIFMQSKSGQDWSDEEVQQIEAFEKLIYTFCDRSYASTIAKDLSMFDNDLMVYPLTFFLATVKNLIRQGRIGEFGGVYFNIKHFSSINDRFGRDCATNIMKLFIHGILEKILYEECICRVGGDNFVVLFKKDNLNIIKNYLSGMPITFNDGETVTVTTTAGYYMIPEVYTIVRDIYNSTIFSDIVKRNQVRKIDQLERVVKYTFSNVGNTFSAKSISDYLKSERRSLDNETVYSYLEKLEKAYLLHRCSRYDLQGREVLKTQEKFYLADTSLRYSVLGYNSDAVAASLENVVYLELCRRGYTVNIGKTADGEIDFVASHQNEKIYVQVTQEIKTEKTAKREYERLLDIHDNYPKYVLLTDDFAGGNYEGIKTMHVADFLLSGEY